MALFVFKFYLVIYVSGNGVDLDYLHCVFEYSGELCNNHNPDGRNNFWVDLSSCYSVRICVSRCNQTQSSS